MTDNGEFKGSTKQAIADLKSDVGELKTDIKSLNSRFWIIVLLLSVAIVERLPQLTSLVFAK